VSAPCATTPLLLLSALQPLAAERCQGSLRRPAPSASATSSLIAPTARRAAPVAIPSPPRPPPTVPAGCASPYRLIVRSFAGSRAASPPRRRVGNERAGRRRCICTASGRMASGARTPVVPGAGRSAPGVRVCRL